VGCQVQALRSIQPYLGLEALYVLGTNCVDNGRRSTLDKFLAAASSRPHDVLHYEFAVVSYAECSCFIVNLGALWGPFQIFYCWFFNRMTVVQQALHELSAAVRSCMP
jgi:hypothetical protein